MWNEDKPGFCLPAVHNDPGLINKVWKDVIKKVIVSRLHVNNNNLGWIKIQII